MNTSEMLDKVVKVCLGDWDGLTFSEWVKPHKTPFTPKAIYLFGSYAAGTETKTSDLDLYIEFYEEDVRNAIKEKQNHIYEIMMLKVTISDVTGIATDIYTNLHHDTFGQWLFGQSRISRLIFPKP